MLKRTSIALLLSLTLSASSFGVASGGGGRASRFKTDAWEQITQRTLDLADAFAANQNNRSCSELLAGLALDLPRDEAKLSKKKKTEKTFLGFKVKTEKLPLDVGMRKYGGYAFWFGFLGIPVLKALAPDAMDPDLHTLGLYLEGAGFASWFSGLFWKSFLPNPEINVPVEFKKAKQEKDHPHVQRIKNLFFNRLSEQGLSAPGSVAPESWLLGLSNGMPARAFEDLDAFDREVDLLTKRVQVLQAHLIASKPMLEESSRILLDLQTAPALQPSLSKKLRREAWLRDAIAAFAPLLARANALQEAIHLRGVVDELREVVHFQDRESALFFQVASPLIFESTRLEETLKRAKADGAKGLQIAIRNFEKPSASGGVARFELELTLTQKSGTHTRSASIEFLTEESTLENVLSREIGWAYNVAPDILSIVEELELTSIAPAPASEPAPISEIEAPKAETSLTPQKVR